ncbi:helix-turn-helix transcriptional regulator (plasmid) [Latilactobacillus curvatus]|uniref:helix-turn-helix domain-containing protein n=1 Tax=Latilactobacillus curvatus TaxID=28038 RepID=UPI0024BB16EB|nr:helix-turn-helix transcriptional regulator [Latilactobacillus curvatus]WHQ77652.1 helix-turn-helix transcriptional regulator [Latilactobacillus curvatus]WHQ79252.1 helix-turn-helix transcriptional regulator [Latilactobacillus curvatus]WHQ79303.1 helix-turn-helix transcriptional regulator [Latilactobacillus curvatus]
MTPFDRVKELADKQKISITRLEENLDFGKNYLYKWKKSSPNSETLQKVADYFQVSTDYLLGRTDVKEIPTKKEPSIDDDDILTLYRIDTDGLSEEDIADMRTELEEYNQFMRERLQSQVQRIKDRENRGK